MRWRRWRSFPCSKSCPERTSLPISPSSSARLSTTTWPKAGSKARNGQMRLDKKVAVITGAASGIGKEIARLYAREGAKIAIADLDGMAAEAAAREIDPSGRNAIGVAMDVSDEGQVEAGIGRVIQTFGALDVLVSNAGVQIVAPIADFEFGKWKKLLAIHLDGAFLTTRAALRQMYRQNSGAI